MKRKAIVIGAVAWMLVIVAIAASGLTMHLAGLSVGQVRHLVSEEEYQIIERYRRLDEIRETIDESYYEPVEEEVLVTGAIRGMMESLEDPYTFYYTPEEMAQAEEEARGVYHGVGMVVQITDDRMIEIVRVYDEQPADLAGVRAGDYLIAVDGTPVSGENGKTLNDAVTLVQGEDGTAVSLTLQRGGDELTVEVVRSEVNVSNVEYCLMDDGIGYVNISQFTGNDVEGFEEAVSAFKGAEIRGMVVDLRSNPGGRLDHVVSIADMVLPEGVITYVEDREGNRTEEHSDGEYWDIPMVILVDGMSASASELFSAAAQDYDRASVVGTTTFGKGIVQTLITFSDDGAGIQLTTESYFSPKGRSIHKTGVEPDVYVEPEETDAISFVEPDPEKDRQLAVALEELEKRILKTAE